jgi:heme exporter protein C
MKRLTIGFSVAIVLALMVWGFYQAIYVAPTDAMQGEIFRIIYYHVPSAAVAFLFFALNLIGSIWFLTAQYVRWEERALARINFPGPIGLVMRTRWKIGAWMLGSGREQAADALAVASAEVGVVFCTVVLITGPIWGRRAWGIWWTWDARLTTTLVLWLIYVSYLLLRRFAAGPQVQTLAAVLGIFGALDVPIVYMSNRWWRTQHPAPVFGGDSDSGMDPTMKAVLGWNMLAWMAWGILILALRYQVERKQQKIAAADAQEALDA